MRRIFVDSAHLIALLSARDRLHAEALRLARELSTDRNVRFVTTHLVLAELLAAFSRAGTNARLGVVEYVRAFVADPHVEVVSLTEKLFDRGVALYSARSDKRYSLTDCVSMVVCDDMSVRDILTSDRDFEQEGYVRLLGGTP